MEAPNVSEGRQAAKQGDIREQAHRRGTHHQMDASVPNMALPAPCLARSNHTASAYPFCAGRELHTGNSLPALTGSKAAV